MLVIRPRTAASVILALGVLCVPAHTAEELTVSQAVEIALKNNPTIAGSRLAAEAARHAASGARALTNPEITVAPSVIGDAGADSAILLTQPLEINGSRRVRGRIASDLASAAAHDSLATTRDIVLQVTQTYWEVARAQELVKLNEDNVTYLETLRRVVEKQLDVGAAPGAQLIKTEVELARARQELAQARLELARSRAVLNALLNRPTNTPTNVTSLAGAASPSGAGFQIQPQLGIGRDALLASALTSRPEVASARAQVAAALGEVNAARLLRVPDIALEARRETFEPDALSGVAISANLPVFDWGSASAEKRRARGEVAGRQKELEAVRNRVALDVEQAIQQVETMARIVREYQGGILDKSEELARMARTGYEKGATNYLEVLEAQRTLRATRTEYYSALASHAKAVAQLEWATGGGVKR